MEYPALNRGHVSVDDHINWLAYKINKPGAPECGIDEDMVTRTATVQQVITCVVGRGGR